MLKRELWRRLLSNKKTLKTQKMLRRKLKQPKIRPMSETSQDLMRIKRFTIKTTPRQPTKTQNIRHVEFYNNNLVQFTVSFQMNDNSIRLSGG